MLRIVYRNKPRKMRGIQGKDPVSGHGLGPGGRIEALKEIVTKLIRHERLEGNMNFLDETRGYVELLIQRAQKHGNKHKETMELADFWIKEKDLIPKLFEVLAPRYSKYETSFTHMYRLPTKYPGRGIPVGILELRNNPYPPVIPKQRDMRGLLTNVLIEEMRKDFYKQKYQKQRPDPISASPSETTESDNDTADSANQSDSKDTSMKYSLESESYHRNANIDFKAPQFGGTPV